MTKYLFLLLQRTYSVYLMLLARLRAFRYSPFLRSMGREVFISSGVNITDVRSVEIGNRVSIHKNAFLEGRGGLTIGNDVMIAPYVSIWTSNHCFADKSKPMRDQGYNNAQVTIEDDVWIGAHSVVLPGVTLSRGSVIGAGSVVTKNVEPYSVVAGNPAKMVHMR